MSDKHGIAIVTGDVTIDWNLVRFRAVGKAMATPGWWTDDRTQLCCQRGGAAMLATLMEELGPSGGFEVRKMALPPAEIHPEDPAFHHSYALWYQEGTREGPAWRVQEFLGLNRSTIEGAQDWQRVQGDAPEASVVLLDDAGLGFRDQRELWPQAVTNLDCKAWIVVKMARPVADGPLWEELCERCQRRVIVVMSVNDLRLTGVQISRELSWERTAQDIYWELTNNPRVRSLSECAHVIVSFYTDGALLLSRPDPEGKPQCTLFFDPDIGEGMWRARHPGKMIGYTTCLTASVAWHALRNPAQPELQQAIKCGIAAMRLLHLAGYDARRGNGGTCSLAFPFARIAAKIMKAHEEPELVTAEVEDPVQFLDTRGSPPEGGIRARAWTILESRYRGGLDELACRIVLEGPQKSLQDVPLGRFGKLLTVDRSEIEGYRRMQAVLAEYCAQPRQTPISVAVFGPPGTGKRFGISQVANEVKPGQVKVLTFNLSQFAGPDELAGAFHQVRDVGLSGQIPLVFWDEFDSRLDNQDLGWLPYFLAPMQDGTFQEGQVTHPIGQAIFVFAGGTCDSVHEFISAATKRGAASANAKGPDFVSHLKGYVNVIGPNRRDIQDSAFVVRRALLLRVLLQRTARSLFEDPEGRGALHVDEGVLEAFLHVSQYKHGVRSMEAVIAMSTLAGKSRFERSCLPSEAQLSAHVDGEEFLALTQKPSLEGQLLEKVAEAVHGVYCRALRDRSRPCTLPESYSDLSGEVKAMNRDFVLAIPKKLSRLGYALIPARGNESALQFTPYEVDAMAQMEHERWRNAGLQAGWPFAPVAACRSRHHEALVDWDELSEDRREMIRLLVRSIPRIMREAGYVIWRPPTGLQPRSSAPVFVSYESADHAYAKQVYDFLEAHGVPTFFSQESLPELGDADFQKGIEHELDRARHLVVVASDAQHAESGWVRFEWSLFLKDKLSGRKTGNLITVTVGKLDPQDLPPGLRAYEVIALSQEGLEKLLRYVA